MGLETVARGATQRSKAAWDGAGCLSFGIESGLFTIDGQHYVWAPASKSRGRVDGARTARRSGSKRRSVARRSRGGGAGRPTPRRCRAADAGERVRRDAAPPQDVCVAAAYDGAAVTLGLSCAFEIPPAIIARVLDEGLDLSQATRAAGFTDDEDVGSKGGLINILTNGRVTRRDYTVQAVRMALALREPRGR